MSEDSNAAENLDIDAASLGIEDLASPPESESGGDDSGSGSSEGSDRGEGGGRNLDLIKDIPLKVTVELGRTRMVVSELLNLGQGSVIELNKLAGEPMEVLVNEKLVARGEAVVVNEKFGVRLTDIISPTERVEQLK